MSRRTACWACRGTPGPRPCPERPPGLRRPTAPAGARTGGQREPGGTRSPEPSGPAAADANGTEGRLRGAPTDNEMPPGRHAVGSRSRGRGPSGQEKPVPAPQALLPGPEWLPSVWASQPGQTPGLARRGARAAPRTLTMAGGAVPSRQRVVPLQPGPGWAITWGGGEGRRWRRRHHWLPSACARRLPRPLYKRARNNAR